jgi:hypothetical protein
MHAGFPKTPALLDNGSPDTRFPSWPQRAFSRIANSRAKRVVYLLLGIWVLNAFDVALTIRAQADGMLYEQNPLARRILVMGAPAILLFKVALVASATYVLYTFRRFRCAEFATALILLAYVGVAFQWQLCYDMYEVACSDGACKADFARVDALIRYLPIL